MAIRVPGKRDRRGRVGGGKRSVVAALSLTAMVDLFTVLVVFLLQNYASTGEVIHIPKGVSLPQASKVKELKPSNVVVITNEEIRFNSEVVAQYDDVKDQDEWLISKLRIVIEEMIVIAEQKKQEIGQRIKSAIASKNAAVGEVEDHYKMTIQSDKEIDFLTIKKIMYTLTQANIKEINFAVLKRPDEQVAAN